jgi:putative hydrolase of the HAD superfamily
MKKYKHIFFDLDNTLWDFERNSTETLTELYHKFDLQKLGIKSAHEFIAKYNIRNTMMWEQYRLGKIDKETLRGKRFAFTFWDMGIEADLVPAQLADEYISTSPKKNHLFPEAAETLAYLHSKYILHIITNGFHEVQYIKLESAGIKQYFQNIIISEHTGYRKPDVNIFNYAMNSCSATSDECIMVGDGLEVDIIGARNAGWSTVYFNPKEIPHSEVITHEIKNLNELRLFL